MKKKVIALGLVSAMAVTGLAACSPSGDTDTTDPAEKVVLTIATNRTDLVDSTLQDLADDYMAENENVEIKFEGVKDYDQTVGTQVSGGAAPDIYQVLSSMSQDVYPDYFLPLDDLGFSADNLHYYESNRVGDSVYVLNDAITYEGIVYNKKAFETAGITEVPRTTAQFLDACQKLEDAGITAMGTSLKDVWPIYPWVTWDSIQVAVDGSTVGKNKYIDSDVLFDDTMLTSMNLIRDLQKNGQLEPDVMSAGWDQLKLDMSQAKTAMFFIGSWFPVQLVDLGAAQEDIGMFPFPDAKGISVLPAKSWGVSKDSENADEAKDFLKYMIEDGRYTTATSEISGYKDAEVTDPAIEELLSYGVETMSPDSVDPAFTNRLNEIECDGNSVLQAYITEADDAKAAELIKNWNTKWAEARAAE